ncbi:MAG TPA: ABC transporter permease [Nocardioidaceae bacterium]|nr:ABC transporter permease [Nocardioidaceae bacterium]
MNPARTQAIRLGLRRGRIEAAQSLRSPQDQVYIVVTTVGVLGYLLLRRNDEVEGTDLLLPAVAMPSILGALIAFGIVIGPAYSLAMEREDGTLLRHRAVPNGLTGYVVGQLVLHASSLLPQVVMVLVPSFLLFDDLMSNGAGGWAVLVGFLVLGLLATLPIGMIIGAVVPNTQKIGTWGMLPVMTLAGISGIFYPLQALWGWVQIVAQVFPMYWLGLGLRSSFLPADAASAEIGDGWRRLEAVAVLGTWAIVGIAVLPLVLRRMARRTSGSQVEAAREQTLQWVR